MVLNLGDVAAGSTLYVPFATYNAAGASVTITGLATTDIEIYKNGSATQRSSDAGYALLDTDGIDFDGITGIHGFSVDLSDNTDAGFYAAGSVYWLVVSAITVDSQTVNFVYYFTIDKANVLRPTTAGRTLDVASTGEAGIDLDNILFSGNGPLPAFGVIDRGTAQAADATTITLRAGFSTAAANMVGKSVWVYSSTNGLHATGLATAYNNTTKVLTVGGLGEAPTGTVLYVVFATANGSTAVIADAVWDEDTTGHTTSGTFGEQLKTDVDAILVDTGTTLDGRIPAALVSGRIDASVGAMAANTMTAAAAAADLTTELQSGLATQASVDTIDNFLDTEIAAILALLDDPRTEPGQGAPPVNPDAMTKLDWIYKFLRNKITQTATQFSVYADDATTVDHKATVSSDGTTLTRGEIVTGP